MKQIFSLFKQIKELPVRKISLSSADLEGKKLYSIFNKRHPRMPIFKSKSLGVALICTKDFISPDDYVKSVSGKNSAAYYARKAIRNGYLFDVFNPNDYTDAIHQIHWSSNERQGKKLSNNYEQKITSYPLDGSNQYFGVFLNNTLVAYCWCILSGELLLINRIMGHQTHLNGGVMYLLLTKQIEHVLANNNLVEYVMYDTMFGASDGLKLFKKRTGFKPYRVKWNLK